jgi:2-oxoglutarate dehydrogenase complex dehydrogenase (E1) component-like enzyme
MYKKIREMPTVLLKYADKLIKEGTITKDEFEVTKFNNSPVLSFEQAAAW